jgi:hypothetical protein
MENEIVRHNMPDGTITYNTLASTSASNESRFIDFAIENQFLVNGNNVIAVEVHQSSASSSDMSFDLELSATFKGKGQLISSNKEYTTTLQSALSISAVFERDGKCVLPGEITEETTLQKACSPYLVPDDVNITSTGKLIIEPVLKLWMSDGVSIFSSASIQAKGTNNEPVIFKSNPQSAEKKWGIIHIKNAQDTVFLKM